MIFLPFSIAKNIIPCSYRVPLSHLTSCIATNSSLYLANSLATVVSEPDLQRLNTFNLPNITSLFHCLGRTRRSVQARGTCIRFVTRPVFILRICQHLAHPASRRAAHCRLSATAYSIYCRHPPNWRPFLREQYSSLYVFELRFFTTVAYDYQFLRNFKVFRTHLKNDTFLLH